ncbi:hypothetical protein HHK36_023271 [Tetracentron sinense]|uniref:Uncharacterized protein n=1 Tax=Tetracentron sinense TaxID=13715 RepID=A0A834YQ43_TETSI|nr:hypothetical protein HHK36_023271 [Tetracentron sinense]
MELQGLLPLVYLLQFCKRRYIPRYTFSWLVKPMWLIISMAADLTLVPSAAIGRDLQAAQSRTLL